jgi:hypothetical protein
MLTKIVAHLKTGSISNVVPFGSQLPAPPYIVVKPERDILNRGRLFKIIVHMSPGQQIFLEDYVFNDLSILLDDFASETRHRNFNELLNENEYDDIVVSNDDGTISMGRYFLMPSMIF